MEPGFTAQQASKLTNCSVHQLRYWDQVELVKPSIQTTGGRSGKRRVYSFRDLVALRVLRSLLDSGMSLQRIRRAWGYLRRKGDIENHLGEVRLETDGSSIFQVWEDEDIVLDALRDGQLAFLLAVRELTRQVEEDVSLFELDRQRFLDFLHSGEEDVRSQDQAASGGA